MNKPILSMIVTAFAIATLASCASPGFRYADDEHDWAGIAQQHDFGRLPLVGDFYGGSNDWGMTNRL
jgi:hypothetical protein